ncbi:MAG: type II secretion system F family protein [Verrucomicrobiota bacterium]
MPAFAYSARDATGQTSAGTLDAPTRRDAVRRLQARGLQPVRIQEEGAAKTPARRKPKDTSPAGGPSAVAADTVTPAKPAGKTAPTRKDCLPFLEGLADLIRSGMSAGEAIRLLALRLQHPRQRTLFAGIWSRLGEGHSLSAALAAYPAVFDSQTVNLIAAGEATGNLGEVLERLIIHFREVKEMRSKLIAAMAYPGFICLLACGVILFFLFFLLPRLQTLLDSLGGNMPPSTRLLIIISEATLHYGPFVLVGAVVTLVTIFGWRKTAAGRLAFDALMLRIPFINGLITRTTVLNFCQTLSVLLENGVTTADALRLTERTVGNEALKERLNAATDRVLEGESLSGALQRTGFFPRLLIDRVGIAEQTGNLAPGLRDIARSYRAELDRWLHTFTTTVSGAVLAFAFAFVAFLAYAIVSAVFQVSSSFRF